MRSGRHLPVAIADHFQGHHCTIDEALARVLEIDRDPLADRRLDLANAPVGLSRKPDEYAGYEKISHHATGGCLGNTAGRARNIASSRVPRPIVGRCDSLDKQPGLGAVIRNAKGARGQRIC